MDKILGEENKEGNEPGQVSRQLAELSLIYNIGRSLSATLDLDALLTRIVDAAVAITQAEEGLLLLPDADSGELTIRAAKNVDDELVRSLRIATHDSLAGRVMQTSEPVLVNNDSGWEKIKTEYLVKSLIYVPLVAKGDAIGVLGVDNKITPIVFSERDQEMLTALASYAAIAIDNAQLYEDAVTRARDLALLADTASAVSSSLNLAQVLNTITHTIANGLKVDWCEIALWYPEAGRIRTLAEYRAAIWHNGGGPTLDLKNYPETARLLREGTPLTADVDSEYDDPAEQILLRELGSYQRMALPLDVGGEIIGLIEAFRDNPAAPPYDAKTVSRTRPVVQRLTPHLLQREVSETWREEVLSHMKNILQTSKSDRCNVSFWDEEESLTRAIIEFGSYSSDASLDTLEETHPLERFPVYEDILHNQNLRVIQRGSRDVSPDTNYLMEKWRAATLILIPMVFKDRTVGILELGDISPERSFTNRELDLAKALANQVATAIENARLFGDLEQSLTDLREAQSQLVQSARLSALGELAAVVAHQIKNPLTTIMGDAEILLQDLPEEHPNHDSAAAIFRAGKRARSVVDRLLNMARPESEPQLLDVNETIQATLSLVGNQLQRNDTRLDLRLDTDLPPINAQPGQLEDVWLNLLINSRDSLSGTHKGTIGISSDLASGGGAIKVTVWDTGSGIPPENLGRIFDPFFTTKPRERGTGLGLYICQRIVEQHNGQIDIDSKVGEGTRVSVSLPLI